MAIEFIRSDEGRIISFTWDDSHVDVVRGGFGGGHPAASDDYESLTGSRMTWAKFAQLCRAQAGQAWTASPGAMRWAEEQGIIPEGTVKKARRRVEDAIRKSPVAFETALIALTESRLI